VIVALPLCPSLVAVTEVVPGSNPVTSPLESTVAMSMSPVVQLTDLPVSAVPFWSRGVAVNWAVPATVTVAVSGLTSTEATGTGTTVTLALPLCPSLVAVTLVEPGATAVTRPVDGLTVATDAFPIDQVTVRPVSTVPSCALVVAVNCLVPPTVSVAVSGLTITDATGT
jgi:hypothetical protein